VGLQAPQAVIEHVATGVRQTPATHSRPPEQVPQLVVPHTGSTPQTRDPQEHDEDETRHAPKEHD
jgi:hypothetical protein